jgi:hypothetical protein
VGWRERDWAKWTDAERQRFFGSTRSTSRPSTWSNPPSGGKRRTRKETAAALILVSAAAVAYGSSALNHSSEHTIGAPSSEPAPTHYLRLPRASPTTITPPSSSSPPSPRYTTMSGPSSVPRGTYITVTGALLPGESGPIVVEGQWESGPWYELASTNASNGGFRVRYALPRPGVVHVRLALPDGDYDVRTIDVT